MAMRLPDLSRREDLREIMDEANPPPADLDAALSFLAALNRSFGGHRLVLDRLDEWARGWPAGRPLTVLDVGTGAADYPLALARWARRRGLALSVVGLDGDATVARLARERTAGEKATRIVQESLQDHARSGARYDFVLASLMLHHVPASELEDALRALDALALRGLLVNDLRRCLGGYLAASVVTLAGNYVVRHDGPVSVRRAFTVEELDALAARAGLRYLKARREPWFRLSLAGLKSHG